MITKYLNQLVLPASDSHKGQNGKLLIIAGSELFHAPVLWAAEVASRVVDMVHVSSPAKVNERLMREKLKQKFWNGIVVPWERVEEYIEEDDCILIGPGMPRKEGLDRGERPTEEVVNNLVSRFAKKRWVIDGGALQTINPELLRESMILTPHQKEWERISQKKLAEQMTNDDIERLKEFSKRHDNVTVLLKGRVDIVCRGNEVVEVEGGNAGMTKGGTGDVLAGLVAALAAKNELVVAAVVASVVNKLAGERLYSRAGSFYNATDLVGEIPQVMRELTRQI